MKPRIEQGVLAAAGATAVASVALALSAWRAVEVADAPPEPPALVAAEEAGPVPVYEGLPQDALALIASNEPFRSDRAPAPEPYRMPGDRRIEAPVRFEAPPPPEPPDFVVVGTVAAADGGLAVIRTDDGLPPSFVRVNESVGGYRLVSVAPDGAVLARGGETVRLAVADPAILREQPTQPRARNSRQREQQQARENLQRQTQRLQEALGGQGGQNVQMLMQGLPPEFQAAAAAALEQLPEAIRVRIERGELPNFEVPPSPRPAAGSGRR